ncbi:nanos homolog 2-like [Cyprinodon tularosa]|uniref:nanos homolog 2-like n=1 Tax=Cyprinodon tularosa TaxID=77115 RepID=UPI0018E28BCE|nr:nanos homolog 2-like [Cyprinodon tularosa]
MQAGVYPQSFDMWRDYMGLSSVLLGHRCPEGPRNPEERSEGPVQQIISLHASLSWMKSKNFPEIRSTSNSLSDSSCSGGTSADLCHFCRHNGESPLVYRSHALKSDDGKVTCPILRRYTCPICGASGDHAHTRKYCPEKKRREAVRELPELKFW